MIIAKGTPDLDFEIQIVLLHTNTCTCTYTIEAWYMTASAHHACSDGLSRLQCMRLLTACTMHEWPIWDI